MTDTLFIHLSSSDPAQPVAAALMSATDSILSPGFFTTLDALSTSYAGTTVVALIPGSEALSTVAVLPKVRSGQVRKMIPFALEEQIAGDLDHQHFAVGRPTRITDSSSTDGLKVPVVVIRRETIDTYLEVLRTAGFDPSAVYLDESLVAAKPGDVVAWVHGEEVFLRAPSGLGIRSRVEDLAMTLDLMNSDPPMTTLGLQIVGLSGGSTDGKLKIDELETRFSRVQKAPTATPVLDWLLAQRTIADPINLLQGKLEPPLRTKGLPARWRRPSALAAGLLALILIDYGNTWRVAALEEKSLDLTIAQAGGLSGVGNPVAPSPLRQALVDLANSGIPVGTITSISHQGNIIRVTLSSADSPEALVRSLSSLGWHVDSSTDDQGRALLTLIDAEVVR